MSTSNNQEPTQKPELAVEPNESRPLEEAVSAADPMAMEEVSAPAAPALEDIAPVTVPKDEAEGDATEDTTADGTSFFIEEVAEIYSKKENIVQKHEVFVQNTPKRPWSAFLETLPVPPMNMVPMAKYTGNFPESLDLERDRETTDWADTQQKAVFFTPAASRFSATVARPGSKFTQGVEYEGKTLAAGAIKLEDPVGGKLTGERAVNWVRALVGMGHMVQIPLWHSGFWVTIKTPSDGEQLEFNMLVSEEKIAMGRQSYGLAFSNSTSFMTGHMMDFIMNHVIDSSLKDVRDIREHIVAQDYHTLAWGMACAIWRTGFQYRRATILPDGSFGPIVEALLAVPKISWTDHASLTEWQKSHMAQRHGRNMTVEQLKRYRSEFNIAQTRTVRLSEEHDISVELRMPMINDFITSGQKWINNIVQRVDQLMARTGNQDGQSRNTRINDLSKASMCRQYTHWVGAIIAKGVTIDNVDDIENTFDDLSSIDEIRETFFKEVGKFIDDTTVSVIAVPAIDNSSEPLPRFPHLVLLDPVETFFTLLGQKAARIAAR